MVILVILIALVLAAPYGYQLWHKDNTINFKDFDKAAAQLSKLEQAGGSEANDPASEDRINNPVMFAFNPNNLSIAQWKQLGLSTHQAEVIKHYEAKGGRFYSAADVKKMYALTAEDFKRLEPFIRIPKEDAIFTKKAKPGELIELNSADSARMTMIRGIGSSFAVRIVRYRNRLGGFYQKEQLKEIYGIDSLKYAEIKEGVTVNAAKIHRIDINRVSFDQLRIFPYLSYKQVNAIIEYRRQHGDYASIADMQNIAILDEGILRKIEPYLKFK